MDRSYTLKSIDPPIQLLPIGLFTPNDVKVMMDEIQKMENFDHPHVMTLLGVCLDAGPGVSIIMPYMANGSLWNYLKKEKKNLVLTERAGSDTVE